MLFKPLAALLLPLLGTIPVLAADSPPALQRTGSAVPAGPQTLADRAKSIRVNKAVFDDFNPPQVLFDPEPTPAPAPPLAASLDATSRSSTAPALPQPRRVNPLGEYINAKSAAEATARCPKATAEQKQAANERLEKATQNFDRQKAQVQQRQPH